MRAGTDFEQKILAGPKNVKFNFINVTDPYHKYYQYKILEAKEGTEAAQAAFADDGAAALAGKVAPAAAEPSAAVEEEPEKPPLVKPDDEKYTVHIPPGLTLQELDIIKLTAQYVARNGAEFLRGLRSREESKREFMFLKETHSLNTFFKRLTDAYSSVLLDSKEALQRLQVDATDSAAVLTRCACPLSGCQLLLRNESLHAESTAWGPLHGQLMRAALTVCAACNLHHDQMTDRPSAAQVPAAAGVGEGARERGGRGQGGARARAPRHDACRLARLCRRAHHRL